MLTRDLLSGWKTFLVCVAVAGSGCAVESPAEGALAQEVVTTTDLSTLDDLGARLTALHAALGASIATQGQLSPTDLPCPALPACDGGGGGGAPAPIPHPVPVTTTDLVAIADPQLLECANGPGAGAATAWAVIVSEMTEVTAELAVADAKLAAAQAKLAAALTLDEKTEANIAVAHATAERNILRIRLNKLLPAQLKLIELPCDPIWRRVVLSARRDIALELHNAASTALAEADAYYRRKKDGYDKNVVDAATLKKALADLIVARKNEEAAKAALDAAQAAIP